MRRNLVIRIVTLTLAWVHSFPALKHLRIFVAQPTLAEAWKGVGAAAAVVLYLLPPTWQARALARLWNRRRALLVSAGWLLAGAHYVPAADHFPKLLDGASWGDLWRGLGSATAVVWFVLPVHVQARALRSIQERSARFAESYLARRPARPSGAATS